MTAYLSEVSRDIGQILFASMFIGPLLEGTNNWSGIAVGFVLSIMSWLVGLAMLKFL